MQNLAPQAVRTARAASLAQSALELLTPGDVLVHRHTFEHTHLFAGQHGLVALTDRAASRSVCAVRLDPATFADLDGVRYLLVAEHRLVADGLTIDLRRTWRTRIARLPLPAPEVRSALADAVSSAGRGLPMTTALEPRRLVGLGAGLTPSGDDILCGALAAAHAWGDRSRVDALWSGALPHLGGTTALSGQLLATAWRGHACGELRELLIGLSRGRWRSSYDELLRIGHTSGADLAHGVLLLLNDLPELDEGDH